MNAMLAKLALLLQAQPPPEATVIYFDSLHVRQMEVVEGGTYAQMKRCLLNLPELLLPFYGTYAVPQDAVDFRQDQWVTVRKFGIVEKVL